MTDNRTIEPASLNEAARILFDLAEDMRQNFQSVNDDLTEASSRYRDLLPDAADAIENFTERWSGYEHRDMKANATTLAEFLAVFASDAEAVEEYTAADFTRIADPKHFAAELRQAEIDADSAATAYDGPR